MKYVKYDEYDGMLKEGECLLMSKKEFDAGGKYITGIPIAITPDGNEPVETEEENI